MRECGGGKKQYLEVPVKSVCSSGPGFYVCAG